MTPSFSYAGSPFVVRPDIVEAHRHYWAELAKPGSWWTGAGRVAIADAVRGTRACALCQRRKQALSPYAIEGEHDGGGALPEVALDAVHRVVSDASRLTRAWLEKTLANGLGDGPYVELLGVLVAVVSIDSFHHGLGLPLEPLPEPLPGAPTGYRPPSARPGAAWVPWIPAGEASEAEADLYPAGARSPNVLCALSLVPDAVRAMAALSKAYYVAPEKVADPTHCAPGRALDRAQMELIAGRVSALNECFY